MTITCLVEKYANNFKKALLSGKIDPDKLIKMSSEERRKFFSKIVGKENAKFVNTEFESKLLLKNQKRGFVTWAKRMSGLKKYTRKDIIEKIKKLDRALNPTEEKQFLADIAEKRLGLQMDYKNAQKLVKMTEKIQKLYNPELPNYKQSDAYWEARQELNNFMRNELNKPPRPISKLTFGKKIIAEIISVLRGIKTGFDMSAPLRQGRALFGTREWNRAFLNMFKYAKSPTAMDRLEIEIMRHKYADQLMQVKRKLGLTMMGETFTQREEDFASKLIDKIPVLKGSERAFVGFLNDLRFRRFVKILEQWEKSGRKDLLTNKIALESLANTIGAATGRGTLGSFEKAGDSLNTVLFSPRWMSSRIQLIINPFKNKYSRIEAAKALARLVGTSAAFLGLAKMAGADIELDTTSSDFGKIKIGNTRLDITGGLAPYIVFMTRMAKGEYKYGNVIKLLNTGMYNSKTRFDLAVNFISNKTAPVPSLIRDFLKGKTFEGKKLGFDTPEQRKFTYKYIAEQLFVPLITIDSYEAFKEGSGGTLLCVGATTASFFGIGVNTYKLRPKEKVRQLWQQGNKEEAIQLLRAYVMSRELTIKQAQNIKNNLKYPDDILYFKSLDAKSQVKYLKKDYQRYYKYAKIEALKELRQK